MTEYIKHEREYVPWTITIRSLAYIGTMLRSRPSFDLYQVIKLLVAYSTTNPPNVPFSPYHHCEKIIILAIFVNFLWIFKVCKFALFHFHATDMTEREWDELASDVIWGTTMFWFWEESVLTCDSVCQNQGSKLTLANSQNASYFNNLRLRKISTSKRLRVRIMQISQTFGKNLLLVSPSLLVGKLLLAELKKRIKKLTLSPTKSK